jgi:hypothetical protein
MRSQLYKEIMALYARSEPRDWARTLGVRYGVPECRLMTLEQLQDLIGFMRGLNGL